MLDIRIRRRAQASPVVRADVARAATGPEGPGRTRWDNLAVSPATPFYRRYVGIHYSGAETPTSGLKGLRVCSATPEEATVEVSPPAGPSRYWTRRTLAQWLVEVLSEGPATLVGIDHAFSFPLRYFEAHGLAPDWPGFLEDFRLHWPTDADDMYVDFVRDGLRGDSALRSGSTRWRRLTDRRAGSTRSVFQFEGHRSVAKATHAGLPWLLNLRERVLDCVHFWPFDGWVPPAGRSTVVEVIRPMCEKVLTSSNRTGPTHDAGLIATWLRESDRAGRLSSAFVPALSGAERARAQVEGWILGVM